MHTHEDKPLSTLLLLSPLSSPSVELVLAGSGAQEFVIFNCVPWDLCLCCSISLQWASVEQVGPSVHLSWYYVIQHWCSAQSSWSHKLPFLMVSFFIQQWNGSELNLFNLIIPLYTGNITENISYLGTHNRKYQTSSSSLYGFSMGTYPCQCVAGIIPGMSS